MTLVYIYKALSIFNEAETPVRLSDRYGFKGNVEVLQSSGSMVVRVSEERVEVDGSFPAVF